jgi:hypothetical protein
LRRKPGNGSPVQARLIRAAVRWGEPSPKLGSAVAILLGSRQAHQFG